MQRAAAAGLVLAYFLWFSGRWVTSGFTPDDLMNCHRALEQPLAKLLLDHFTIYSPTPEYRPLGSLFYRALYAGFGFHPLPFQLGIYSLLILNLYLTYLAVRRLTGNEAAAWTATVLHAWHGNWTALHVGAGFCYDVLCYTLFAGAFAAFGAGRWWLYVSLFLLSLNAKEVAVSLPLVCLAWRGGQDRRAATAAVFTGVLTAMFVGGRLMSTGGLGSMDAYVPRIDWTTFVSHTKAFLSMAVYGEGRLAWGVAILSASAVWSLIHHRRAALIAVLIMVAGVLPVAFIPQRGLEAVYVPSLGAMILLALPLAALCRQPLPAVLAAVLLAGTFHHLRRDRNTEAPVAEARHIAAVAAQMRQSAPCLAPRSRVLFLRDPFPRFDWNSLFLVRLLYGDQSIEVYRPGRIDGPPETYDVVFDWDAGAEGGPGQGVLRRIIHEATSVSTTPNTTPSK